MVCQWLCPSIEHRTCLYLLVVWLYVSVQFCLQCQWRTLQWMYICRAKCLCRTWVQVLVVVWSTVPCTSQSLQIHRELHCVFVPIFCGSWCSHLLWWGICWSGMLSVVLPKPWLGVLSAVLCCSSAVPVSWVSWCGQQVYGGIFRCCHCFVSCMLVRNALSCCLLLWL